MTLASELVCQGLDDVISNANPSSLSNCVRDDNCTMVMCQTVGSAQLAIQSSSLTLLPCQDPSGVRLQLQAPSVSILVDQALSQSDLISVNTELGVLPVRVFLNHTANEIGILVRYTTVTWLFNPTVVT